MVLHNIMTTGAGIVVCTGILRRVGMVPEGETTMVKVSQRAVWLQNRALQHYSTPAIKIL